MIGAIERSHDARITGERPRRRLNALCRRNAWAGVASAADGSPRNDAPQPWRKAPGICCT